MRLSRHFSQTTKTDFKEASVISHQYFLRAGFMRQLASGIYAYMPMLQRVLMKISQIVREEMNKKGAEELLLPQLMPRELWEETDRWKVYTDAEILFHLTDRKGGEYCLGPTHEEAITDIARREIKSYKQLPVNLYQIQSKFRDEIRPRFGLMRGREFVMKDAYSFHASAESLDQAYQDMYDAYCSICERCGLRYRVVEADSGAIGGTGSAEFMVLADTGEDLILSCDACEYAANIEKAESIWTEPQQDTSRLPLREVFGENITGVEELVTFLNIPIEKTVKTLIYQTEKEYIAVMIRGDQDVNEIKLKNALNCEKLGLASEEMIKKLTGAEVGYAGPVNLPKEIKLYADLTTKHMINFEAGTNKTHYHALNVNFEDDFPTPPFIDVRLAKAGESCARCKQGRLESHRGIEMGHIFKLGTKYSESMDATYLNEKGEAKPLIMGCYGIGVSRVAAAAIEQNHDDKGMIWPKSITPYQVHLVGLNLEKAEIRAACDELYGRLLEKGYEVLYDDRDLQPGAKFGDADLIGIPVRITLSARTSGENKVEWKFRHEKDHSLISQKETLEALRNFYK